MSVKKDREGMGRKNRLTNGFYHIGGKDRPLFMVSWLVYKKKREHVS